MHPLLSVVCFGANNFQKILNSQNQQTTETQAAHPPPCGHHAAWWFSKLSVLARERVEAWVSRFLCFRDMLQACTNLHSNGFQLVRTSIVQNFCRGSWWLGSSWVNLSVGPSILQSRMHWFIIIIFKWFKWCEERVQSKAGLLHWLPHSTCPHPMSDHLWALWIVIFSRLGLDSRWRSLATGLVNNLERKQRNWSKTSWAL